MGICDLVCGIAVGMAGSAAALAEEVNFSASMFAWLTVCVAVHVVEDFGGSVVLAQVAAVPSESRTDGLYKGTPPSLVTV